MASALGSLATHPEGKVKDFLVIIVTELFTSANICQMYPKIKVVQCFKLHIVEFYTLVG